jgi:hypothetical protein
MSEYSTSTATSEEQGSISGDGRSESGAASDHSVPDASSRSERADLLSDAAGGRGSRSLDGRSESEAASDHSVPDASSRSERADLLSEAAGGRGSRSDVTKTDAPPRDLGEIDQKTVLHPDLSNTVIYQQGPDTIEVHQGTADDQPPDVTHTFDADEITGSRHHAKDQKPAQRVQENHEPAKKTHTPENEPGKSNNETQRQPGGQPDHGDGSKKPDSQESLKPPDQEQVPEGAQSTTDHPVQPQSSADHPVEPQSSADRAAQPQPTADLGSRRKGDGPIPFATSQEQWEVAKDAARNWLIDHILSEGGRILPEGLPAILGSAMAEHFRNELLAPEPPEHPSNLREWELRNSYEAMQRALSVAEAAGSLVVGPIAETASEAGILAREGTAAKVVGPAGAIPEDEGAFLEGDDGVFGRTNGPSFLVRAGPPGSYGDHLFSSVNDAEAYAEQLAARGEEAIRETSALPYVWPGGREGNPVDAVRIFQVPADTPYIQGVVGKQLEGGTVAPVPRMYGGGGPQVVIPRDAELGSPVREFPVTKP